MKNLRQSIDRPWKTFHRISIPNFCKDDEIQENIFDGNDCTYYFGFY